MAATGPVRVTRRLAGVALSVGALLALAWPAAAWADASLRVEADPQTVQLGEAVTVRIRARTEGDARAQIELSAPDLADWDLSGQSESTRVDGFRGTRTTTITLNLQPKRAGRLTIGAFTLKVPGAPLKSDPITITVADGGVANPQAPAAPGQAPGTDDAERAPDEVVFLRWEVDGQSVWLGQQLDARLYVYVREGIGIRDFKVGEIDLTGFWNEQHKQDRRPRTRRIDIGGLRFEQQEVARYTLFPLRAGEQPLPAVGAEMVVRRMRVFGGPRSLINRTAAAVPITVKPLPVEGRPAGFSGPAVGRTRLTASVDQRRIDASQGVQLTVVTRVDGLVQNVPPVTLPPMPDFKVFPAGDDTRTNRRAGQMTGVRRQTWLLRPNRGGRLTLPRFELPYFDPDAGSYAVARTPRLTVEVQGEPGVEAPAERPAGEQGPGLRDIRAEVDPTAEARGGLGAWFPAVLAGAPLLFALGWLGERWRARRDATAGSRAARTAARDARLALERIGRKADGDRAGYSAVARVVVEYLERRFGAPFNGLTRDATREALRARGVGDAAIERLLEELDACDFARFAPAADAASGLAGAAGRAADAIDAVEREVG